MDDLAVLTPSFRGDARLFADLHRSVMLNTDESVVHHVVVPPCDARLFRRFEGPRCRVWTHRELLPRYFVSVPYASGLALNLRRPLPPVRGCVVQQVMKLAAAARLDARAVLVVDSDAVLVRPASLDELTHDAGLWHYCKDHGVTEGMRRHVVWHGVARRILGLPDAALPPLPDYVSPISVWDPSVVRSMLERISDATGRPWIDVVASQLHVSEFVVYGVFVDEVLGRDAGRDRDLCHNYYARSPLRPAEAAAFAERMPSQALGVMISSHSRTPHHVRRMTFRRCREIARALGAKAAPFIAPLLPASEYCAL